MAYKNNAQKMLAELPASAWGAQPQDIDAQQKSALSIILKDPDSAKISQQDIIRTVISSSGTSTTPIPVWASRVLVNARNGYGGYVGFKTYIFYFYNGQIIALDKEGELLRHYLK